MKRLDHYWYSRNPVALILAPLAALFCLLVGLRRLAYRRGWLASTRLPVPVIVVGNVTVGGSGKTPLVIWLVEFLRRNGYRPGVVSRGYGGDGGAAARLVDAGSDAAAVGDEPKLIFARCGCPLAVAPDRTAAARLLLAHHDCNVLVSDDGLQHYRLARDVEIAVIDGTRRLGNGLCLPAGPLREPARRLRAVDLVVGNCRAQAGEQLMTLQPGAAVNLHDGGTLPLAEFRGRRVHAVAGIGHPPRFFRMLRELEIDVIEHPFPDHHRYGAADLQFGDGLPVLMTEKDGVKCSGYGTDLWAVAVDAYLPEGFGERLLNLLAR